MHILLFAWFLAIAAINKLSFMWIPDITSYELPTGLSVPFRFWIVPLLNFDGRNFLTLVTQGYDIVRNTNHMDLRVFFPLYPLLVYVLSFNGTINSILVGLFLSTLFFLACYVMLLQFAHRVKVSASKTLLAFLVFPTSFYFVSYYSESLFLFLVLCTFLFLSKKRLFMASCFICAAAATRITGLALLPPLLWHAWLQYKMDKKIPWYVLIAPLGIIVFMFFLGIRFSDPLAFLHGHSDWDKPYGLLGPLYALTDGFKKLGYAPENTNPFAYSIVVSELFTMLFLLWIVYWSYKKIPYDQWLYVASSALVILASGVLYSVMRYAAVIFPLYLLAARIRSRVLYAGIMATSFMLWVYFLSLFLRNYWVS